jgi:hypothetical protein
VSPVFSALNDFHTYVHYMYGYTFRKSMHGCNFTDVNGPRMPNSLTMTRATKKSTEIAGVKNEDLARWSCLVNKLHSVS